MLAREAALNTDAMLNKHRELEEKNSLLTQEYNLLERSAEKVTSELENEKEEAEKQAAEEARCWPRIVSVPHTLHLRPLTG